MFLKEGELLAESYFTVKNPGCAEIVEKKSRFIATVRPVSSEAEAVAFINEIKQKYWDARHNVYAYILRENNIQRYTDDGEPAGTAGVPVLDMLKKEGLTDIAVVVTRYFGGILLGTGGLVHAYSKSAREGVISAEKVEMVLCSGMEIDMDYTLHGKILNELSDWDIVMGETVFTDRVKIPLYIRSSQWESLRDRLIDITNGKTTVSKTEEKFIGLKCDMLEA